MDNLHRIRVEACRCLKQDIPEVEAVIQALTTLLEKWWLEAIEATLRRGDLILGIQEITTANLPLLDVLAYQTPDRRSRQDIEALLTALVPEVTTRIERQILVAVESLPAEVAQAAEDARDTLLLDAALALGLSLTLEQLRAAEARLGPLRAAAISDLETLMHGRLTTRRAEIREAIERMVQSTIVGSVSQGLREGLPVGLPSPQTLREELRVILGAASPRQWIPFVADQWSYRWFNIGQFIAAREDGFLLFQAINNPPTGPDRRTTPFCRRIHGRLLDVDKLERQIVNHVRQALNKDIGGLMQNWPLLPASAGDAEAFEPARAQVGLPPYHARCRTVVLPVRAPLA